MGGRCQTGKIIRWIFESCFRGGFWPSDILLRLRDAYLKEWASYGAEGELLKAFELSQRLGFLRSALTHYKYVLPGLELKARWEMENMVGFYLRLVLEYKSHRAT
jgi:hypothetical protein